MALRAKKTTTKKKTTSKKKKTGAARSSGVSVKTAPEKPAQAETAPAAVPDLERVLDDLLQRRWPRPFRWEWPRWGELSRLMEQQTPSVDIVDKDKEVLVRAELPGVKREDLDVSIAERTLTIKGSSRKEEKEEQEGYFRHEIRSGSFSRSVLLPADVNAAKAAANFKDGVLELHLPKARASKRKQISVG